MKTSAFERQLEQSRNRKDEKGSFRVTNINTSRHKSHPTRHYTSTQVSCASQVPQDPTWRSFRQVHGNATGDMPSPDRARGVGSGRSSTLHLRIQRHGGILVVSLFVSHGGYSNHPGRLLALKRITLFCGWLL